MTSLLEKKFDIVPLQLRNEEGIGNDALKIKKLVFEIAGAVKSLNPKDSLDRILVYSSNDEACVMLANRLSQVNIESSVFKSNYFEKAHKNEWRENVKNWKSGKSFVAVAHYDVEKENVLGLCQKIYLFDSLCKEFSQRICGRFDNFMGKINCTIVPVYTESTTTIEKCNLTQIFKYCHDSDVERWNLCRRPYDIYSNKKEHAYAHMRVSMESGDEDEDLPIDPDYNDDDFVYY
ncbi:unnamed protein product [Caenorhabditis bovis]|uniref:Uncharacterized protein n=1 Tax=Caenorhabditis bovis TaxID=2654633 RepID=A0A8S1F9Q8_9PELO|nr:unnamed protein product [Caenorhabditis bovis]